MEDVTNKLYGDDDLSVNKFCVEDWFKFLVLIVRCCFPYDLLETDP